MIRSMCTVGGLLAASLLTTMAIGQSATAPAAPTAPAAAAPATNPAPLIPRDIFFSNPERSAPQLSPNGKWVSYLAPVNGVLNVWVAPANDLSAARVVTKDTHRGVRQYFWAHTNNHILYMQDDGGDENWRIYRVDLTTGDIKDLTPFDSIPGPDGKPIMLPGNKPLRPAARVLRISEKFPEELLIGLNNRNPQYHDVYVTHILTGEMKLMLANDEWMDIHADDNFDLRFGVKYAADGSQEYHKFDEQRNTSLFQTVPMADSLTTAPVGFDQSGQTVFMFDSRGRNTSALFALDTQTGEQKLLAENARADAGGVLMHPTTKQVQAVSFTYEREEWTLLDQSIKADLDYLKTLRDGELFIGGRSQDDSRWLVSFATDTGPIYVYLYDRKQGADTTGTARLLFSNRPALEQLTLSPMLPRVIRSRDGLDLVSYLTLPAWTDADRNGVPDAGPVPMVLLVHGGPWARDEWGFSPTVQWLANRGYAVLQVNFRGSTGFGKNFVNAGNREWAGKMHDDLLDAVNWAVEGNIARKDKVAIMGGSYGGYATLVGLTFTPDVFACGVDIVGPSNIVTLLNTIPPYWAPAIKEFAERVGDHQSEDGRKFLESRSPITFVDRIRKPLLIGQGANDPRVKQSESDQIVAAMQAKNIPVTYVLFPDEGHGFARPENRTAFNAVTEAFLAANLGGRAQPIGGDMEKSSAKVPVGAEFVPGLSAGK